MKTKVLKFPDGRIAVSKSIGIRINKQKPIIEEEVGDMGDKELNKLMENPHKFKFSKKSVRVRKH